MAFSCGYALVIGVGTYAHMSWANIPISATDAEAVKQLLSNPNLCGYPPEQVTFLHDQTSRRSDILDALDALAQKTTTEDTTLVYYCGHGEYGTDGDYYVTTHDTEQASGLKVKKGTGISEGELLAKLRAIPAKRFLLLFNTCHSGELSPNLGIGTEGRSFGDIPLPPNSAEAVLSTGEGRIMIAACRPEQKSYIGTGKLSIFTQALVDGLSGKGYVGNNAGYVSAFGLYEHIYLSVKEAAATLGQIQEPELTVLRGVGPFPVSLYRGATDLGTFDRQEPLPEATAAREIEPSQSERRLRQLMRSVSYQAELHGSGAIAQGRDNVVAGERGVAIGGNVQGGAIITGDNNVVDRRRAINTQGGTYVEGAVNTGGGDFVGRDKTVMSGDFRGANVNVKAKLENVTQRIEQIPSADQSAKDELKALIVQLNEALQQTPEGQEEEAEAVADYAKELVDQAAAEKPNKIKIRITGEGLKMAAQNLAAVAPTVIGIATQIVGAVLKLTG